jgi:transposase-like protein
MEWVLVAMAIGAAALLAWLSAILAAGFRRRIDLCPSCRSDRVRPSWPTVADRVLRISAIASFRCQACMKRFYGRRK